MYICPPPLRENYTYAPPDNFPIEKLTVFLGKSKNRCTVEKLNVDGVPS